MISLKDETKNNLENLLGITLKKLDTFSVSEEIEFVNKKNSHKISFSKKKDARKVGRGNPLLARKRIRTMEEVDKRLDNLKW